MAIEGAKDFIRKPLSEGFKAWSTLRDTDNVTMKIQELGHLMAWYAEIVYEQRTRNASVAHTKLLTAETLALTEGQANG